MNADRALLVLLLTACGSSDPAPPPSHAAPPSSAPPSTVTVAPPSTIAPTPSSAARGAPPVTTTRASLDATQRETVREAVREGRAAATASHYAEALAAFQRAVALDQSNRRLRCEAGYVAHLAGDETQAETLIDAALAGMPEPAAMPDDLRVPYAQCLYNAGLVYEATDHSSDARSAFVRSLALRASPTVQAHLDALPGAVVRAPLALLPSMTDAEVRVAVGGVLDCPDDGPWEDWDSERPQEPDSITPDDGITLPSGVGASFTWLRTDDCGAEYMNWALIVRSTDHVAAYHVLDLLQGGGAEEGGGISDATVSDLVPGGLPEIRLTVEEEHADSDAAGCIAYDERSTYTMLCTFEPTIACGSMPTSRIMTESCDQECMGERGDDGCGREHRPRAGEHTRQPLAATLTIVDGQVVVAVTADTAHVLPAGTAGTHDLASWIRMRRISAL